MARNVRETIVNTAWELFREKGFGETTINDIIREADISRGTFYYYFRSKDNLLDTLSEILDDEYRRLESEEPGDMSAFEKLLWIDYEVHRFIEENIDYRLMAYLYSVQITKEESSSLLDRNRYYFRYVERLMEEGRASGDLTEDMSLSELVEYFCI